MRTGSDFMTMLFMAVAVTALGLAGYAWQTGATPDVERIAGRMWADFAHETFAACPRGNGVRFWMGCTDQAPVKRSPE